MNLHEKIQALVSRLKEIDEKQGSILAAAEKDNAGQLSEDQRTEYDSLQAKYEEKSAELATAQADLKRANDRKERKVPSVVLPRQTASNSNTDLEADENGNVVTKPRVQTGIPATVRRHRCQHLTGTVDGRSAEERAYRLGMFALAKAAHDLPTRYQFQEATQFVADQWAVHGENDTHGSRFLVPEEFMPDIIDLRLQYGVVRRLFQNEPMSSDTKVVPRQIQRLTAYFVDEDAAGTESNMAHDDVRLVAKKIMVLSRMSKELSMDSAISLGDRLAKDISWSMAYKEDLCGLLGDGTSTYGGIMGAVTRLQDVDGAGTDSAGLKTGSGNAYSELTLADFNGVLGLLPTFARANATWVMSPFFYHTVAQKLELAQGGVTLTETKNLAKPMGRFLFLGYPVEFSEVMPTAEANSQVCALLGDFSAGAFFGDRSGIEVDFSDSVTVGGQSVWERDQIAVKGTERFDIVVHSYGNASTAGAIVGLQTASS